MKEPLTGPVLCRPLQLCSGYWWDPVQGETDRETDRQITENGATREVLQLACPQATSPRPRRSVEAGGSERPARAVSLGGGPEWSQLGRKDQDREET